MTKPTVATPILTKLLCLFNHDWTEKSSTTFYKLPIYLYEKTSFNPQPLQVDRKVILDYCTRCGKMKTTEINY